MKKTVLKILFVGFILFIEFYFINLVYEKCDRDAKTQTVVTNSKNNIFTTKDGFEFNTTDYQILCKLASAEAGRENYNGMKNVITVVLNRINDESFKYDKDVVSTVFRDWQFSCIRDGGFSKAVVDRNVEKATLEAIQNYSFSVEENLVYNATHFANLSICNPKWQYSMTYLFTDEAGHSFFR